VFELRLGEMFSLLRYFTEMLEQYLKMNHVCIHHTFIVRDHSTILRYINFPEDINQLGIPIKLQRCTNKFLVPITVLTYIFHVSQLMSICLIALAFCVLAFSLALPLQPIFCVRLQALVAVTGKITVFWHVAPYSLTKLHRVLGRTCLVPRYGR
jgi:uncharacterized membrane protein YfbV (UPF0208 family)